MRWNKLTVSTAYLDRMPTLRRKQRFFTLVVDRLARFYEFYLT